MIGTPKNSQDRSHPTKVPRLDGPQRRPGKPAETRFTEHIPFWDAHACSKANRWT